MKTLASVSTFVFALAFTTLGFAGNHPANPPASPAAKFATTAVPVRANPWHSAVLSSTGAVAVARVGNGTCPVMGLRITSKRQAVISLPNGKSMEVCCPPCKQVVEEDLSKYRAYMY